MSEVVAFYQHMAQQKRPTCPALVSLQEKSLAYLAAKGFPSRLDENWRYSPPASFLQARFQSVLPTAHALFEPERFLSTVEAAHVIYIENGQWGVQAPLPSGVQLLSLEQAFEKIPTVLSQHNTPLFVMEHGFHALNAALLDVGLVLYVQAGTQVSLPISLLHYQNQMNQAVHTRCMVFLEEQASVTLLEEFAGQPNYAYLTTRVMEVSLAKQAHMTHVLIERESQAAHHVSHTFVHQAAQSEFQSHVVALGGQWVRADQSLYLQAPAAKCELNGVSGLAHTQQIAHNTVVFHEAAECESRQDYKGMASGRSRAIFNGRVVVQPHAQKTKAYQQNKNLLLSKEAEVDTKPQLEIEANDVSCTHGATVGQLDEEALFYFASRGILKPEAVRLMLEGFSMTTLQKIGRIKLSQAIVKALQMHLVGEMA